MHHIYSKHAINASFYVLIQVIMEYGIEHYGDERNTTNLYTQVGRYLYGSRQMLEISTPLEKYLESHWVWDIHTDAHGLHYATATGYRFDKQCGYYVATVVK